MGLLFTYRLFVCQDENENEPEDESFRSFWIKPVTNEPGLKYNDKGCPIKNRPASFYVWPNISFEF